MGDTCRDEVLDAFKRLERRHGRDVFSLREVLGEVEASTSRYRESTIRTHISARMCRDAPEHHTPKYEDLERVGRGLYRRVT